MVAHDACIVRRLLRVWRLLVCSLTFAAAATGCTAGEPVAAPTVAPTLAPTVPPTLTVPPTPAPPTDPFALAAHYLAPDADTLADRLEAAEAAIADPSTPPDVLHEQARIQQAAYRQVVEVPEWRSAVEAALPAWMRPHLAANVEAGSDLRALTKPRDALPPNWEIIAPASAQELLGHYRAAEQEFGVAWGYLAAIHLVETRMGRIRGTSSAGALGPMQFMPKTWEAYGEGDIHSNKDAIRAAARYLVAAGAPARMDDALWAYNHSDRYVRAVTRYAKRMLDDERAFFGYHGWEVYYRTTSGDALLPVGWPG